MKQLLLLTIFMFILSAVTRSQNVGIGEPNPLVKLTVKSTGLQPSFLAKNGNDDSLIFSNYKSIFLGGYHTTATGVVNISNKHYLPFDSPQLELVAGGERSPGLSNGSMSMLKFSNANSNKYFYLNGYVGADASVRHFSLAYTDPDDAAIVSHLIYTKANGQTGIGTYQPLGKFQVNHRASSSYPTLSLYDSSSSTLPIIQLKTAAGSDYFQIRGVLSNLNPAISFLDFATQTGTKMTLTGDGKLGIGEDSPAERLDVAGNAKVSGEINRPSTGTANLVPIAYGNISSGVINSGSGNFSVAQVSTGVYTISITGESFLYSQYASIVTPVNAGVPIIAATGSGAGLLQIRLYNTAGANVDGIFSFVVYKQ